MRNVVSILATLWLGCVAPVLASDSRLIWEIGRVDGGNSEFALAPGGYSHYAQDGFFVVGRSDASRDWPYVHPGPGDAWAGGVPHTFSVIFGLAASPQQGACRVTMGLLDTHAGAPPRLVIRVNGRRFERTLSAGAGDASVGGKPEAGSRQSVTVDFPAELLVAGDNTLQISTVGGCWMLYDGLALEGPAGMQSAEVRSSTVVDVAQPVMALREVGGAMVQPVQVSLRHFGPPTNAAVQVEGAAPVSVTLAERAATVEVLLPAVTSVVRRAVTVTIGDQTVARREVELKPVRQRTVYILPHSHTDIGYTEIQTAIEDKQVENLRKGIEYARRTASYPEGARFVWNVEVLWAADLFLQRQPESERAAFFEAVKSGQVVLNGMYLNELTGLCRTEELLRLFRDAPEYAARTGVPIDAVMISDVPGYTWGTVTAMAQAGLRYFSTAPNYFDRIGDILKQWENKPFWWVGPSGKERVLVWIPYKGYAMSHLYPQLTPAVVTEYQAQLDQTGYPFDIAYMRWSGHGDNAEPDPSICEFVRDWNGTYAWPRFVISGTGEAFRAFEARYGDTLPEVKGDWTPYWEDGAGSSALETAMNRSSSDRVSQAETLFALRAPSAYPVADFSEAWKKVLLYSEHTWGAWCSVSDPESQATREQWEIKRSYALEADRQSRALLQRATGADVANPPATGTEWEVVNTTSWSRTELVTVPAGLGLRDLRVLDERGQPVPSQRLSGGERVFVARDIPAYAARRYRFLERGEPGAAGDGGTSVDRPATTVRAVGNRLENDLLSLVVDPRTGAIVELRHRDLDGNFVDTSGGEALNDYLFLPGDQLENLQRNGPVTLSVSDSGPLVAGLRIESAAPGCRRLIREVRMVAGLDRVELINTVDKERAATPTKPNDWQFAQKGGKESVNFAFPFHVPDGQLRLDLPIGVIRPDTDLMPSACKNWFTVGRWADVSSRRQGITWVTLDAPLVQVGGLTATLVGSQSNPDVWRKTVEPTQRLYSWAMNNHWGTNYRSYQEGPVVFRFLLQPHGPWTPAEGVRLGVAAGQPLLVLPAGSSGLTSTARLTVEPEEIVVSGLKPSDDGQAWILRLYGASGRDRRARLTWSDPAPARLWWSDTGEAPLRPVTGAVRVPGSGIVTVRAEW